MISTCVILEHFHHTPKLTICSQSLIIFQPETYTGMLFSLEDIIQNFLIFYIVWSCICSLYDSIVLRLCLDDQFIRVATTPVFIPEESMEEELQ